MWLQLSFTFSNRVRGLGIHGSVSFLLLICFAMLITLDSPGVWRKMHYSYTIVLARDDVD